MFRTCFCFSVTVEMSLVAKSVFTILHFRERRMQFVAYQEGREVSQWSLGDKCSVPTGPRSLYVGNQVGFDCLWSGMDVSF